MPLEDQVIVIFAGTQGYADKVPLERMRAWEAGLLRFMASSYPEIGKDIADNKRITDETMPKLRSALDAFTSTWQ
jgi:F-type H+-transporting ATPase subunit alpha